MIAYKKIHLIFCLFMLFSEDVFAIPISVQVPISITSLPHSLFTSVRVTGYVVDGEAIPIPNATVLTQGDSYVTPILQLGDHMVVDEFQFRLLGEIRARNRTPGADDVIVPFRARLTVRLGQIGTRVVGQVIEVGVSVQNEQVQGGFPLAHHIAPAPQHYPERAIFNNGQRLNVAINIGFTAANLNAAIPLLLPDLLSQ